MDNVIKVVGNRDKTLFLEDMWVKRGYCYVIDLGDCLIWPLIKKLRWWMCSESNEGGFQIGGGVRSCLSGKMSWQSNMFCCWIMLFCRVTLLIGDSVIVVK